MINRFFAFFASAFLFLCLPGAGREDGRITLRLMGDSTMADKEELVESPERGWGQLFPTYVKENLHIENHAKNGRSTRSFITEGRWDDLQRYLAKRCRKAFSVLEKP